MCGARSTTPARELWTAPYLSAALGDTPVSVNVTPTGLGDALLSTEGTDHDSEEARMRKLPFARETSSVSSPARPPLVFVQPETRRMRFSEFMKLVSQDIAFRKTGDTHTLDGARATTSRTSRGANDSFSADSRRR